MVTRSALASLFVLLMALVPSAFAGKTELTTYYPSAYGEYINLKSTADSYFATDSGNVGIGTTSPGAKLAIASNDTLDELHIGDEVFSLNDASTRVNLGNTDGNSTIRLGQSATAYGFISWAYNATENSSYMKLQSMPITNTGIILQADGGNVGIGTTAPTVLLEEACPSGFTNIKAGNNQLGCMQTDEANSGTGMTWENAEDYCFDNYGGRLPTTGEWYIAMNNYTLTNETDDCERNDDGSTSDIHFYSGTAIGTQASNYAADTSTLGSFRCWIPK